MADEMNPRLAAWVPFVVHAAKVGTRVVLASVVYITPA
jgi:hypothetical protein